MKLLLFCAWYFEIVSVGLELYPAHGKKMASGKESRKAEKKGKMNKQKGVGKEGDCIPEVGIKAVKLIYFTTATHPTSSTSKRGHSKAMSWRASTTQLMALSRHDLAVGEAVGLEQQRHHGPSALDFCSAVCIATGQLRRGIPGDAQLCHPVVND